MIYAAMACIVAALVAICIYAAMVCIVAGLVTMCAYGVRMERQIQQLEREKEECCGRND